MKEQNIKIRHDPKVDYVSLDFKDGVEAKSWFQNGVIIREDRHGHVLGIDITDSSAFFSGDDSLTLKEACHLLGISESTMRRRVREGKIKFTKPNGKDFLFARKDVVGLLANVP